MRMWILKYTVEPNGATTFPVDMLRYDSSYPRRETDSYAIVRSFNHTPVAVSLTRGPFKRKADALCISGRRWNSFGWSITHTHTEQVEVI